MTNIETTQSEAPAPDRRFGEEILLDYVTGSLDEATALMVAAHLDLCPDARETVDLMTRVGGALLDEAEPVAMRDGAFDAVMALIDRQPADAQAGRAIDDELSALPQVIQDRIAACGGKWSFVTPGVKAMDLGFEAPQGSADSAPGEVKLYRLEQGKGVPTHTHKGSEVTLVLTGAFADGRDRFGPGEVSVASPEITHRPIAEAGDTCFALAITDAPLQLTGALGLVQRALSLGGSD